MNRTARQEGFLGWPEGHPGKVDSGDGSDGVDDALIETRERPEELPPLRFQLIDDRCVLLTTPLALVETPGLQEFGIIEARDIGCDVVPEVGILFPGD